MQGGEFGQAFKRTMPLAVSIFGYGLVFGVLARQSGLTPAEILLMSATVFAGSAQFVAVGMIAAGASAGQIVATTLLLNMRHLLMGASLAPYLRGVSTWKLAGLAHLMNDESYAVVIDYFREHRGSVPYFLGAGCATGLGWILSSALAGTLGGFAAEAQKLGLDFAFVATFIGLLVPQIKSPETLAAFAAAGATALAAAIALPGKWYIMIGTVAAAAVGVAVESRAHGNRTGHRGNGPCHLPDAG